MTRSGRAEHFLQIKDMDLQGLIDLFAENFVQFDEVGASVCIWRHGEQVLHLANGYRDREKRLPWTTQTPVLIWSATKGLTSACLIHAASEHGIDLNRTCRRPLA